MAEAIRSQVRIRKMYAVMSERALCAYPGNRELRIKKLKEMENGKMMEVKRRVIAARQAKIDGLSGIERMKERLFRRLRGWVMRESGRRVVGASEVVDKVRKYAPKAILRCRENMKDVVCRLWSIDREVDEYMEDVEFELDFIHNINC
jgi:hypothetical protein